MKTLFRLVIFLLLILGAVYFFTIKVKGRKVEIEVKKEPGLQEVREKAAEIEKKAADTIKDTVKKTVPGEKKRGAPRLKPHEAIHEGERPDMTEEDRAALRKLIREKLEEDQSSP